MAKYAKQLCAQCPIQPHLKHDMSLSPPVHYENIIVLLGSSSVACMSICGLSVLQFSFIGENEGKKSISCCKCFLFKNIFNQTLGITRVVYGPKGYVITCINVWV